MYLIDKCVDNILHEQIWLNTKFYVCKSLCQLYYYHLLTIIVLRLD